MHNVSNLSKGTHNKFRQKVRKPQNFSSAFVFHECVENNNKKSTQRKRQTVLVEVYLQSHTYKPKLSFHRCASNRRFTQVARTEETNIYDHNTAWQMKKSHTDDTTETGGRGGEDGHGARKSCEKIRDTKIARKQKILKDRLLTFGSGYVSGSDSTGGELGASGSAMDIEVLGARGRLFKLDVAAAAAVTAEDTVTVPATVTFVVCRLPPLFGCSFAARCSASNLSKVLLRPTTVRRIETV